MSKISREETLNKVLKMSGLGLSICLMLYFLKNIAFAVSVFSPNGDGKIVIMPLSKSNLHPKYKEDPINNGKYKGTFAYSISDTMTVNERETVYVVITLEELEKKIKEGIEKEKNRRASYQKNAPIHVHEIKISDFMSVELRNIINSGEDKSPAFLIDTSVDKIRKIIFKKDQPTYWQWDIIPLKAGDLPLKIIVKVIYRDTHENIVSTNLVFEKIIHVHAVHIHKMANPKEKIHNTRIALSIVLAIIFIFAAYWVDRVSKTKKRKALLNTLEISGCLDNARILISKGDTKDALRLLINEFKDKDTNYYKQLLLLSSKFAEVQRQQTLGLEENKIILIQKSQIDDSILTLIDKMESEISRIQAE